VASQSECMLRGSVSCRGFVTAEGNRGQSRMLKLDAWRLFVCLAKRSNPEGELVEAFAQLNDRSQVASPI
jgi:hypothetical protein